MITIPYVVIDDLRSFADDRYSIYLRNYEEAERWIDKAFELTVHDDEISYCIENLYMDFDLGDFSVAYHLLTKMNEKGIQVVNCHVVTSNPYGQRQLVSEAEKFAQHTIIDPNGKMCGLIYGDSYAR